MAIKKQITTVHGIILNDAYHRVTALRMVGKVKIAFSLCVYADPEKVSVEEHYFECDYDINGDNPIAQAYAHLKTLPEYADAVDC